MLPSNLTTTAPRLELIDVTVTALRNPKIVVLEGVNWCVCDGDYWAIAGLMRSGKSDLMAVAAGVTPPAHGTYRVFNTDEFDQERERILARRRVSLVFDGGQLLHHLTLAENIALPLFYHEHDDPDDADQRVAALIAFTDLEPWAAKYPSDVNRNWQQRIGLARALALRPEVLLLDSPLTSLDPRDAIWWLNKVDSLHRGDPVMGGRPLTIAVTGDDLRPWHDRANRFAAVKNGQFICLGDRGQLAAHPEPLLQELLPVPAPKS
jgi:ABC-type transporter Mla maintaining outer membrane lipid asymmetry ATPase subunit MlaF